MSLTDSSFKNWNLDAPFVREWSLISLEAYLLNCSVQWTSTTAVQHSP